MRKLIVITYTQFCVDILGFPKYIKTVRTDKFRELYSRYIPNTVGTIYYPPTVKQTVQ